MSASHASRINLDSGRPPACGNGPHLQLPRLYSL